MEEEEEGDEGRAPVVGMVEGGGKRDFADFPGAERDVMPKEDCPRARSLPTPISLILQTYWLSSSTPSTRRGGVEDGAEGGWEAGAEGVVAAEARRML
jgi:hypothetical protein